ncbi:MAG: ATP phosphoribosyltransferase regulatory subunit [Candidatus Cloacimonetes bacterium]|nr:ATP phosphoribosyltransferase regulatory subunit [Candidatus Cloacimonadota bacterium]
MSDKIQIDRHILTEEIHQWQQLENVIRQVAYLYHFQEVRPAMLQSKSELERIYSQASRFFSKHSLDNVLLQICGDCNIALSPENTMPLLLSDMTEDCRKEPQRIFHIGPVFRRYHNVKQNIRRFHCNFNIIGHESVITVIQLIRIGIRLCDRLGFKNCYAEISSFGCDICRQNYIEALDKYFSHNPEAFCWYEPCKELPIDAPASPDYICNNCHAELDYIKKVLTNLMTRFEINPRLHRALYYQNGPVFNICTKEKGKKIVLGSGGRFDRIAKYCDNTYIPAVAITFDQEHLIGLLRKNGFFRAEHHQHSTMLCSESRDLDLTMLQIAQELHDNELPTILELNSNTLSDLRKKAIDKGVSLIIYLEEAALRTGKALIINLVKDHEDYIPLSDILDTVIRLKRQIDVL